MGVRRSRLSLQLTRRSLSTNRVLLDPALLVLRAVLGVTMFAHGWQKLTGPGLEGVGGMFDQMGVPLAQVAGPATMLVELVGGVLLVLGLATRVAAAAVVVVSVGAIAIVHWSAGFYAADGGYELVLVLAAMALTLVLTGPGAWSLDAPFARRRSPERAREMVSA